MTKFEEEFKALTSWDWVNVDLIQQILTRFGNWHSDEEFQEMKESYWNQAESILSMLEEIKSLKSQLQQQALPVVPECVAKVVELLKKNPETPWSKLYEALGEEGVTWLNEFQHNDERFGFGGLNSKLIVLFHLAINGYQVEKPQLFYLREKNTNYYLNMSKNNGLELVPNPYFDEDNQFTQQEIDSMETGSYEQIKVEEEK